MADQYDPSGYPDGSDDSRGVGQQPIAAYNPGLGGMAGGTWGDQASYQTQLRAGYGNSPLFALQGMGAVGGGAMVGGQNMLSTIGSHIRPLTYVPPAYIATGFTGRYVQHTGIMNDLKNMVGIGPPIRGARDYEISMNAAGDLGERLGLNLGGVGLAGVEAVAGTIGGRALGLVGGFGAFYAAGKYADAVRGAVAERREISNYLEQTSDRFITASAAPGMVDQRKGSGMSIQARREVGDFLRDMDVKDPLLNMKELTGILKGSVEAGMFTGTRDMDDFKKKFKDVVENVKVVATTLHQTLEEGVKTIKDLRGIGIDPMEARRTVMNAETMGRVAGRSAGEMMQIGMQGAELYRGTGVQMEIGFQANQMNLASIRASRDAGMISQEAVAQAGGEEALAQRMTATSLGFAQSSMGRGLAGAFFNKNAPGTGFDAAAFLNFATGGAGIGELSLDAAKHLGSPEAVLKFQANQAEFMSQLGKKFGGQGLEIFQDASARALAEQLSKTTHVDMETAMKAVYQQQFGLSPMETEARLARMKNAGNAFEAAQISADQTRQQQGIQDASQNFFLARVGAEAKDWAKEHLIDPLAAPINKMVDDVKIATLNFVERQTYGIERYDLTGSAAGSYVGRATAQDRELASKSRAQKVDMRGEVVTRDIDLDTGGFLAATPGSDLRKVIERGDSVFKFTESEKGEIHVGHSKAHGRGGEMRITLHSLDENAAIAKVFSRTELQAQDAETKDKAGVIKGARSKVQAAFLEAMSKGEDVSDIGVLTFKSFGKNIKDLSAGGAEFDALLLETQGKTGYEKQTGQMYKDAQAVLSAAGRADTMITVNDLGEANKAKKDVEAQLRTGFGKIFGVGGPELSNTAAAALAHVVEVNSLRKGAPKFTDEEKKAADVAFRRELLKIKGEDGEELTKRSEEILEKAKYDTRIQDPLMRFSSAYRTLDAEQVVRGQKILKTAVEAELRAPDSKIAAKDSDRILSIMDRVASEGVGAVLQLADKDHKDDRKALNLTATGKVLLHEADVAKMIQHDAGERQITSQDLGDRLGKMGVEAKQVDQITKAYDAGGSKEAIAAVHAGTMDLLAGQSGSSAAGASGAVGTQTGTAQDTYAIQTSQNLQVLAILQALAAKVYGVK